MITSDLSFVKDQLERGEVVGIPTETVYGLAANIYDEQAIAKIFSTKRRPNTNPLIVHVKSMDQARTLVSHFPVKASILAERFWPGPLTLILPKSDLISAAITAQQSTVAIRMPNHKTTLALLETLDFPLAAPSANPYNRISPTRAAHVEAYFPQIPILEGGNCEAGVESTILSFDGDEVVLLRHGAISIEDIEAEVGRILDRTSSESAHLAPGRSKKHYSPLCELIISYEPLFMLSAVKEKKVGILWFNEVKIASPKVAINHILSPSGSFKEAAAHMYDALHQLEKSGVELIIVERLPNYNLGRTINDRFERAAAK
jgi:L-threonylcarbamoyladenylate synthase